MAEKNKVKKPQKKATKSDSFSNKNYGLKLYMMGIQQNEIAERCGVSAQTITEWKQKYDWETKRASRSVSLEELANKCLQKASELLDSKDFNADAFAKAIAQLKTLIPKNTVDTDIMTFMGFQDFLLELRHEENITETFIKSLTNYQDRYIRKRLGHE